MNDIFIRGLEMPAKVKAVTIKDEYDDYNIYVNVVLCPETQRTATIHELCHIKKEHFYNEEPVVYNEMEVIKAL